MCGRVEIGSWRYTMSKLPKGLPDGVIILQEQVHGRVLVPMVVLGKQVIRSAQQGCPCGENALIIASLFN